MRNARTSVSPLNVQLKCRTRLKTVANCLSGVVSALRKSVGWNSRVVLGLCTIFRFFSCWESFSFSYPGSVKEEVILARLYTSEDMVMTNCEKPMDGWCSAQGTLAWYDEPAVRIGRRFLRGKYGKWLSSIWHKSFVHALYYFTLSVGGCTRIARVG